MPAERQRILHVRSSAGLYGAEYVILGVIPALARLDIPSTLLCLDNPYLQIQPLHAKARVLGLSALRVPCRGRLDFATVQALRAELVAWPGAIVHVHDYKSAAYAWMARGRRHIPIVATSHGQFSSTPSLHLYHHVESRLMRRFDRVCIVAAEMRAALVRAGVRNENIRLIENGIDTNRFSPAAPPLSRAELGIGNGAVVFGAAMRLTAQKNPLGLVEAFAHVVMRLPDAMLVIAGDGPLRGATLARAAALGIAGRVRMLGMRDDLERFYTMLDVFVLPSLYEGLPLALLEAMASQRAIVATRVGHVPEVLRGLDVDPIPSDDPQALAEAMCGAPLQRLAAAELRQRVVERYSVERMAAEHAAIYRDLWKRRERVAA
jgi:glycosyltransferase involved in cell wall biosynthesis